MTRRKACLAICVVSLLVACANTSPALKQSSILSKFHAVYETSEISPREADSRYDVSKSKVVISGAGYTEAERERSHSGAGLTYIEGDLYFRIDPLPIYVPKSKVSSWQNGNVRCASRPLASSNSLTTECFLPHKNQTYTSIYSPERGVESFDAFCLDGRDEKCTYRLRSQKGTMTVRMIAELKRLGLFKKEPK